MPTSYHGQVLDACKAALDAAADIPTVYARREAVPLKGDDLPSVVLGYNGDDLAAGDETFEGQITARYGVRALIQAEGNQRVSTARDAVPYLRQLVRQALHKGELAGVAGVTDVSVDPNPATFDPARYAENLDTSALDFVFDHLEPRNG